MLKIIIQLVFALVGQSSYAQSSKATNNVHVLDTLQKVNIVDVSCGQCQFKMAGSGCNLAVKVDNKPYYVDGTTIDEHGDAHASDGFCESVRKAEVQGKVVGDKYQVTYFKLLPNN